MSKFAILPMEEVVCRFVEMTKTEIIVLAHLYGRRNRKTGQCNPRRSEVARAVGIDKAHVTVAFRNLARRGWIEVKTDGNIDLNIPILSGRPSLPFQPQKRINKVAKSATSNTSEKLRNPQLIEKTKVAHSAPQSCGISTSELRNAQLTYKESLNRQRTDKEQTIREEASEALAPTLEKITFEASPFEHPAVVIYQEKFQVNIRRNFAKEIAERVKPENLSIWNDLIADKIAYADMELKKRQGIATWFLTAFKERIEKKNGKNRPASEREKSAERGANGRRMVEELRRIGTEKREAEARRALHSGDVGGDSEIDLIG